MYIIPEMGRWDHRRVASRSYQRRGRSRLKEVYVSSAGMKGHIFVLSGVLNAKFFNSLLVMHDLLDPTKVLSTFTSPASQRLHERFRHF